MFALSEFARAIRFPAGMIWIFGVCWPGAGLVAAPITYTSGFVVASGANGTSSAQVVNGGLLNSSAANGGTASGGGSGVHTLLSATTLTQRATGDANLGQGTLRGNANSFYWDGPLAPPTDNGGVSSVDVEFRETVTFNNTTGGDLLLPFAWTVEGEILDTVGGYYQSVYSSIQLWKNNSTTSGNTVLQGSSASTLGDGYAFGYLNGGAGFAQLTGTGSWFTGSVAAPIGAKLMATLVISPGQSNVDISARLQLDCRGGWNCNFGNTARFSFDALPDGLTYTSASGVFLSEAQGGPGGEIPEPGTWALLGGGVLGVAALRGRRRARGGPCGGV